MSSIDLFTHLDQQPASGGPDRSEHKCRRRILLQSAGEAFAMDGAAVLPCAVGTLGLG